MFCENCGAALEADAKFCNKCGCRIDGGTAQTAYFEAPKGKKKGFFGKLFRKGKEEEYEPDYDMDNTLASSVPPFNPYAQDFQIPPAPQIPPVQYPTWQAEQPVPCQSPLRQQIIMEADDEDRTIGLDMDALGAVREPAGMIKLQVKSGGQIYECSLIESLIMGRDEKNCSIVISGNKSISRQHCKIFKQNGACYVQDLESHNHTFVNNKEIFEPTMLQLGDTIRLGLMEFIVAGIDLTV